MKKIKILFYAKFSLIIAIASYILSHIVSFVNEYFIEQISLSDTLFLRGSTIILDAIVLLPTIGAIVMLFFNKKLATNLLTVGMMWTRKFVKKKSLHKRKHKKSVERALYVADTLGLFFIFSLPYFIRLIFLYYVGRINEDALWKGLIIGIVMLLVLGSFGKKIMKSLDKFGRKRLKKLH